MEMLRREKSSRCGRGPARIERRRHIHTYVGQSFSWRACACPRSAARRDGVRPQVIILDRVEYTAPTLRDGRRVRELTAAVDAEL